MDISIFIDTPFGDKDAMKDFLFANSDAHRQVASVIALRGKQLDLLPLTDIGNLEDWLAIHAERHEEELTYLGITDMPNMADVDFNDKEAYSDWHQQHALLHLYVNQALGLV